MLDLASLPMDQILVLILHKPEGEKGEGSMRASAKNSVYWGGWMHSYGVYSSSVCHTLPLPVFGLWSNGNVRNQHYGFVSLSGYTKHIVLVFAVLAFAVFLVMCRGRTQVLRTSIVPSLFYWETNLGKARGGNNRGGLKRKTPGRAAFSQHCYNCMFLYDYTATE